MTTQPASDLMVMPSMLTAEFPALVGDQCLTIAE